MEGEKTYLITKNVSKSRSKKKRCNKFILAAFLVLIVVGLAVILTLFFLRRDDRLYSDTGYYRRAGVASDSGQCSEIGVGVLLDGGSSVDSAIATSLCIGLASSQASGIGGGSFMLIYERPTNGTEKELQAFDFREVAPQAVTKEMYITGSSFSGGLSIGVPGEMSGYWAAWQKYGRLPWERLLQPVIDMCQRGFVMGEFHAKSVSSSAKSTPPESCSDRGRLREALYNEDGSVYKAGDVVKLPKLCRTLSIIAAEGGDTFYRGTLANQVAKDLLEIGSIITAEDLESYTPIWRQPIRFTLSVPRPDDLPSEQFNVGTFSAMSGGPVLTLLFNIIEGYSASNDIILTYHRYLEALKFAYSMKTRLEDPKYNPNIDSLVIKMTSKEFARELRNLIDDKRTHKRSYYSPAGPLTPDAGTSTISVRSKEGGAVSITSTVNGGFGSKCEGPRTGIIFNDEMADFDFPEGNITAINEVAGGKRPRSSMTPTIVFDAEGHVRTVIGGAGGNRITSAVAFVLWNRFFHHMDIDEAIDAPRLHYVFDDNVLEYEKGFAPDILKGLIKKGHKVDKVDVDAYVNALDINGMITAVSDKRKGGQPAGY